MHRNMNRLYQLIISSLTIFYSSLSLASHNNIDEIVTEEDFFSEIPVVLSATRLAQIKTEAPASITVIDRNMIEASGAIDLADILRLIPGFQVSHATANTYAVTYHGLSFQYPRKFQVLVDGRSVYRSLLSNVDWVNLGIAIADIEKIEVIRGPNAPVYGSNAFLGTINILTRRPFQDHGFFAQSTVGSIKTRDWIFRNAASTKKFDYRISVGYRTDAGFDDVDDSRQITMTSMRGIYNLQGADSIDFQVGYSGGKLGAGGMGDLFNPTRDKDVTSYYTFIRWTNSITDNQELYIQGYYNYYSQKDIFHTGPLSTVLNVDPSLIATIFPGQPDQTITTGIYDGLADRSDIEFQHNFKLLTNVRVVWGGSLRMDRIKGPIAFDRPDYIEDKSIRFFTNMEWKANDTMIVNTGAMIENNDIIGTYASPRFALNYHASPNNTLRASVTRAIRTPSLYEANHKWVLRFNDGELLRVLFDHDPDLAEEKIISYEIGYIANYSAMNLSFDLKLFREEVTDIIAAPNDLSYPQPMFLIDPFNNNTSVWTNNGYSDTNGFEMQIIYKPSRVSYFSFQYSFAEVAGSLIDKLNPSSYSDMSNYTPRHTFSSLLSQTLNGGWRASAVYFYTSEMEWGGEGDLLDGYDRWDVRLVKEFKVMRGIGNISLIIHNLFNKEYEEFRIENKFNRRTFLQLNINI